MHAGWWLCLNGVMDLIEHFSRLFAYDGWANQEVLTSLRAAKAPLPQALKLMSHIFAAERLWMERLEQKPQTLPVWAEFTAEECERQAAELPALWKKYLAASSEADLATTVTYQNSKGETWSSRKDDILMHVHHAFDPSSRPGGGGRARRRIHSAPTPILSTASARDS